jgi:hypothetical protein
MATLKQISQVVGMGPTDTRVIVRVDGDVHGAEAEKLELPWSVCSACRIDWSQVTAVANVRRYVSRDHEVCSDLDNVRMKTMGLISAVLFNPQVVQISWRYHKARNRGMFGFMAHERTYGYVDPRGYGC